MAGSFNLLTLAAINLKRRSLRTGILAVSTALFVTILVFGLSFVLSVRSSLKSAVDRLGADVLVVPLGCQTDAEDVLLMNQKAGNLYMSRGIVNEIKKVKGVGAVTWQTYLTTVPGECRDVRPAKVVAFDQKTDFIIAPWLKKAIHGDLKPGECILGNKAWFNLGLPAMDQCTLFGNRFTVLGSLHKTGMGFDNCIFVSDKNLADFIKYGRTRLKPNEISVIFVKDKPGYYPKEVATNIGNKIWNVSVVPRNGLGSNILSTLRDINTIFMLTVVLCLALSALLTWAIFSVIVNERKKEIGVMRAIGAKNRHIVKAFALEVFLLGVMGSALGTAAGSWMALYFSRIFVLFREMHAGLTAMDRAGIAGVGMAAGTGVCLLGALVPIIKVKKMDPLTAIKEI